MRGYIKLIIIIPAIFFNSSFPQKDQDSSIQLNYLILIISQHPLAIQAFLIIMHSEFIDTKKFIILN